MSRSKIFRQNEPKQITLTIQQNRPNEHRSGIYITDFIRELSEPKMTAIKKPSSNNDEGLSYMALQPGLEPGTHGLTVRCSTN